MNEISKRDIQNLKQKTEEIKESLNIDSRKEVLKSLESESSNPNLWKDKKHAQEVLTQISQIQEEVKKIESIEEEISTLMSLADEQNTSDEQFIEEEYKRIEERIKEFELIKFLAGKYDSCNATMSIHAGQGGTEAEDWTEMLFRMYTMYIEKKGWKYNITNMIKGAEAGIATVTFDVIGKYSYGILKREHGTHRLVRLSPFNAQNLRQTSFAAVEVIPILKDVEKDIEIPEGDIEFKAVRASGPGGQKVNKTSSAVQITHIPTGITVTCSEERSQLQNRQKAMEILKGKLWKIMEENRLKEISDIKGDYKLAGWGNQIRNYILHPYKLVKDLRTGVESNDPQSVLDGNIEQFLEAQLRIQ